MPITGSSGNIQKEVGCYIKENEEMKLFCTISK